MKQKIKTLILILILSLTGCWDSAELDQRALIGGVGVDIEGDMFKVTSQIIPAEAAKAVIGGTTGGDPNLIWNVTTKGHTVVEGLFLSKTTTGRDPSFSHTRALIFSKKLAEQGIRNAIDYFKRNEEIRRRAWIIVADADIEDVFNSENKLNLIPSYGISEILESADKRTDIAAVDLHEFTKKASCNSSCAYAPVLVLEEASGSKNNSSESDTKKGEQEDKQKQIIIQHTAVFFDYEMIGTLNTIETKGLLWVNNSQKITSIDIKSPNNPNKLVNVTVNSINTSVEPKLVNNKIIMEIEVDGKANINEKHDETLNTSDVKVLEALDEKLKNEINNEITAAIKKAQSLKADIFDFGDIIHKEFPKQWDELEQNWPEEFSKIEYKTKLNVKMRWSGRIDDNG